MKKEKCSRCNGSGEDPDPEFYGLSCLDCNGTGEIIDDNEDE